MRVALNALYVGGGVAGGRTYRDGLVRGLAAAGATDDRFDVFTRRTPDLPALDGDRVRAVPAPVPDASTFRRTAWEYLRLPGAVRRGGYDVYHALGSLTPRVRGVPVVLTIHDLIYRHFPESVPYGYRQFMHQVQPGAARRADRVVVDSRHTAGEVVALLGIDEKRVRVVPLGPGHDFGPRLGADAAERVLTRLGVRRPYLLAVGRGYPHKNIAGLLRAFAALGSIEPRPQVVLIGAPYLARDPLTRLIAELGIGGSVVWTGFVPTADLRALYEAATVFAFPSLAEGFGLPVLEAMACGTPVVASDRAAIPEVVGDAGLLIDPTSPGEFAEALGRVLGDATLQAELRARGFARVREFSWDRCAAATLAVYRELA